MNDVIITVKNGEGISQALEQHVNDLKKDGKISEDFQFNNSKWTDTLKVLDDISEKRKPSIFGGTKERNGLKSDWTKNYIVQEGDISFTESEMIRLYEAMGIDSSCIFTDKKTDEVDNIPKIQTNTPVVDSVIAEYLRDGVIKSQEEEDMEDRSFLLKMITTGVICLFVAGISILANKSFKV